MYSEFKRKNEKVEINTQLFSKMKDVIKIKTSNGNIFTSAGKIANVSNKRLITKDDNLALKLLKLCNNNTYINPISDRDKHIPQRIKENKVGGPEDHTNLRNNSSISNKLNEIPPHKIEENKVNKAKVIYDMKLNKNNFINIKSPK